MRKDIYVSKILLSIYLFQIREALMDIQNVTGEQFSVERVALMQIQSRLESETKSAFGDGQFKIIKARVEEGVTNALRTIRSKIRGENYGIHTPIHEGADMPGEIQEIGD